MAKVRDNPEQDPKEADEDDSEFIKSKKNGLQIGEMLLQSTTLSMKDLVKTATTLLKDKSVSCYLGYIKQRKLISPSYTTS